MDYLETFPRNGVVIEIGTDPHVNELLTGAKPLSTEGYDVIHSDRVTVLFPKSMGFNHPFVRTMLNHQPGRKVNNDLKRSGGCG